MKKIVLKVKIVDNIRNLYLKLKCNLTSLRISDKNLFSVSNYINF